MIKKFTYHSSSLNIYKNLAIEDSLIDFVQKAYNEHNLSIYGLFLWQTENTIVIGRNQDIRKECDFDVVKKYNITISRRKTGGGAVYQDKGNLNFTFIATNDIYDKNENFKIIMNALKELNIETKLSGRNDIITGGKKFSGNAFKKIRNVSLHHGTILISTNTELANKCLTPSKYKLKRHGVNSVKARIVNLTQIKDVTVSDVKKVLQQTFLNNFRVYENITPQIDKEKLETIFSQYSNIEWIYNKTDQNHINKQS